MNKKVQIVLDRLYAHADFERKNRPYDKEHYSLEPVGALLRWLGEPQSKFKSIHIAGTKGKGSTAHYTALLLHSRGYKVGLYASPSVRDLRDRFCVGMKPASWRRLLPVLTKLLDLADERQLNPTVFDVLTACAFDLFSKEQVDIAVVEVGLGGRWDSTNVLNKPMLSVVTTIGLDHTEQLGETEEQIAREKAGIIKPKVPVLFRPQGKNVDGVVVRTARSNNAKLIAPEPFEGVFETITNKLPSFQRENFNLALNAVKVVGEAFPSLRSLAKNTKKHPLIGRYYKRSRVLYDGAHNPAAMKRLVEAILSDPDAFPKPKMHVVCYFLPGKDVSGMLQNIPKDWRITYYELDLPHLPKKAKEEVVGLVQKERSVGVVRDRKALRSCLSRNENLVVTGSFRLVGHLLRQSSSWSKRPRRQSRFKLKKKHTFQKDWML